MHWIRIVLLGLSLAATQATAEVWTGSAQIEFEATSTLHDFTGTAPVEPFHLSIVQEGKFATLGGTAAVAVARLDTRHAKRDANLRKTFSAERYPFIAGVVDAVRISPADRPQVPIQLTIRDATRPVPATLDNWQLDDNRLRFDLSMVVSLRAFNLSPPVILGFIRVGDAVSVRVRCDLELPGRPPVVPSK